MSFTEEQKEVILWYLYNTSPVINQILRFQKVTGTIYPEEKDLAFKLIELMYSTPTTTEPLTLYTCRSGGRT